MQVKYIVYFQKGNPIPKVDIWKTTGEIIHSVYAQKNNIKTQDISSQGYLYFNPFFRKWSLEHYQMDDGVPAGTFGEWLQKRRTEKRDRLLVRKKIHQTDFLNDSELKAETWKEKQRVNAIILRQLFPFQYH